MIPLRNAKRFLSKALKQPGYALRVGAKRMGAYFYYRFGNGRSGLPEAITIFLTHRCNLRCKMCGQWGEGGVTKKQSTQYIKEELPLKTLMAAIDDVAGFRPNVTLFGGEPLLYPGCAELIRQIKSKGMHCLIITNGSLLEELGEEIVSSSLDELNVSLDGNRELHDQIRGMPGLFDKIMRGLKKVRQLKAQGNKTRPLVNLQCTINQHNYRYLGQMTDVADEAGADSLTFHNLIFLTKATLDRQKEADSLLSCSSGDWEGFVFEPGIDVGLLYKKMKHIRSGRYRFSVDFYPNFSYKELKAYYEDPDYVPSEYAGRCLSPWVAAYVFPDGEVRPCLNSTFSYGNIRNNRFADIWNSAGAIKFRRALKDRGMFPACSRCTELYRY